MAETEEEAAERAVWSIWRAEEEESAGEEVGDACGVVVLRAGRLLPEEDPPRSCCWLNPVGENPIWAQRPQTLVSWIEPSPGLSGGDVRLSVGWRGIWHHS